MRSTTRDFTVALEGRAGPARVSARLYPAERHIARLVLGHGAGAGQDSPFMVEYAQALARRGLDIVTFNFPYMEAGRRAGDTNATLEACYRAVIGAAREGYPGSLFIGGKSMGGRIASQVAAADDAPGPEATTAGLVFLGYPLHPPGRADRLRTAHWPRIRVPALFVQGTRDPFGTVEELRVVLPRLADAALYVIEGGDHSFKVPKSAGRPAEAVHAEAQDAVAAWVRKIADQ